VVVHAFLLSTRSLVTRLLVARDLVNRIRRSGHEDAYRLPGVRERLVGGVAVREWGDPTVPAVLLWPGLGSTSAYFAAMAASFSGRAVAVDPPGFGRSAAPGGYTFEGLAHLARGLVEACNCWAIVGHSLGANLAVGVAGEPPATLRAAVLLDGGYMDAEALAEVGMPVTAGRHGLTAWMQTNTPRFADWDAATSEMRKMIGGGPTDVLETYLREVFDEVDGEVRQAAPVDRMADLVLAAMDQDVLARAARIRVPTLLLASGQPAEGRITRERAWRRFADASPLIELQVMDAWGHNAILQDPEGSARLIADWLGQHQRFRSSL
jgi:pimeloyl-ACP methyl ester carboxylesterase